MTYNKWFQSQTFSFIKQKITILLAYNIHGNMYLHIHNITFIIIIINSNLYQSDSSSR